MKSFLERDIKYLKADVEKNSGEIWLLKGVESNALSSFVRTALIQIELKSEVKYILSNIIEVLQKIEELNSYDEEKLSELMDKLEPKYSSYKGQITSLYKDKPVYKFIDKGVQNTLFGYGRYGLGSVFGFHSRQYIKNVPKTS